MRTCSSGGSSTSSSAQSGSQYYSHVAINHKIFCRRHLSVVGYRLGGFSPKNFSFKFMRLGVKDVV